jgi:hypothetical protein
VHPVHEVHHLPDEVYARLSLRWGNARLMAWAGVRRNDDALKRRAWHVLLHGDDDPRETHTWKWPLAFEPAPPQLSAEAHRDSMLGTNNAAMGSLNLIACLALAPDALDMEWVDGAAGGGNAPG